MVVVSIAFLNQNDSKAISVQEVYLMLSLLSICFMPMKSCRTLTIAFHDALHSLDRLTKYFALPDELVSKLVLTSPHH